MPSGTEPLQRPPTDRPERQIVWRLFRDGHDPVAVVLVGLINAAQLELRVGTATRRQRRFPQETDAIDYATRLRRKLESRGFVTDRRRPKRAARS